MINNEYLNVEMFPPDCSHRLIVRLQLLQHIYKHKQESGEHGFTLCFPQRQIPHVLRLISACLINIKTRNNNSDLCPGGWETLYLKSFTVLSQLKCENRVKYSPCFQHKSNIPPLQFLQFWRKRLKTCGMEMIECSQLQELEDISSLGPQSKQNPTQTFI